MEMLRESEAADRAKQLEEEEQSRKQKLERDPWGASLEKLNQKVVWKDGDPIPKQRNPSKIEFLMTEAASDGGEQRFKPSSAGGSDGGGLVIVDIAAPKYMDTSLISVDVHPNWFQVLVKDKLLLLHTPQEVSPEQTLVQRIPHNGHVRLVMTKLATTGTGTAGSGGSGSGGTASAAGAIDATSIKSKLARAADKTAALKAAAASQQSATAASTDFRTIIKHADGTDSTGGISQVSAKRSVKLLKTDADRKAECDAAALKQAEEDRAIAAFRAKQLSAKTTTAAAALTTASSGGGGGAAATKSSGPVPAPAPALAPADDDDGPPPLETV